MSLTVAQIGFGTLRSRAAASTWTRDPVDRLLAAHVLSVGLPLLTKDRTLLPHLDRAYCHIHPIGGRVT